MTEFFRLLGLTQDGSLLSLGLVAVGVWLITTVKRLDTDSAANGKKLDELSGVVSDVRADVAYLRGKN